MRTTSRWTFVVALASLFAAPSILVADDLFVTSFRNNRVMRYDAETGAFKSIFVPSGSGGLLDPEFLAVGPGGDLLVSGSVSSNVLRYDRETGAFVSTFVPTGSGGLDGTQDILINGGRMLVASVGTDQVLRYDPITGAFVGVFVSAGSGGLDEPWGLAAGADGNLYVSSSENDSVRRYNLQTGASTGTFVPTGSGGLDRPNGLTFGPDGHLYVASFSSDSILRYNGSTGAFLGAFVPAGSGGINGPTGLVFGPDGHLYVASALSGAVLRYNGQTGAFLGVFIPPGSGGLDGPTSLLFRSETGSGPCVRNAQTACLLDDRFEVKVKMRNFATPPVDFPGIIQTYQGASSETEQSVSFYSFNEGNVEVFVKMVDACAAPANSFWLFAAGATNAYTQILVRDTIAGDVREIVNQPNVLFQTVADTQAFLTCDE